MNAIHHIALSVVDRETSKKCIFWQADDGREF